MISIIIPTLNEEKYLPSLLDSIKKQHLKCEVIVADAFSRDNTTEIARKNRCILLQAHYKNPADARNAGARIAKSDLLLFLDADTILPQGFLKESIKEFEKRNLEAASCYAIPLSNKTVDLLLYSMANLFLRLIQRIKPFAQGFCIFCKKSIHEKINGFDRTLKFGEDSDYVLRASKVSKFRMTHEKIFVSVRRMEKEGRLLAYAKYAAYNFYRLFFGELEKIVYKFGHY